MNPKTRLYFPGLNALRFLAASLVVLSHIEILKLRAGFTNAIPYTHERREHMAHLAVVFFFVLSGYLITYLLLIERKRFGTISIQNFYVRRLLRIWPLYYIVIFVGIFILTPLLPPQHLAPIPAASFTNRLLLYLAFVPNVASAKNINIPYIDHLWSIGVEEQFYLLWPLLVAWVKDRRIFWVLISIVLLIAVGQVACFELQVRTHLSPEIKQLLHQAQSILMATPLSCMGIGGLAAYAFFYHPASTQRILAHRQLEIAALAVTVGLWVWGHPLYGFRTEVFAVLFGYIILSVAAAERSYLRMEGPRWTHLGNISYGIYATHWIILVGLGWLLKHMSVAPNGWAVNLCLYGLSLPLVIGLATLSYRFYESPFIRLKERFQLVRSGSAQEVTSLEPAAINT